MLLQFETFTYFLSVFNQPILQSLKWRFLPIECLKIWLCNWLSSEYLLFNKAHQSKKNASNKSLSTLKVFLGKFVFVFLKFCKRFSWFSVLSKPLSTFLHLLVSFWKNFKTKKTDVLSHTIPFSYLLSKWFRKVSILIKIVCKM